jgi:hypothetical protein
MKQSIGCLLSLCDDISTLILSTTLLHQCCSERASREAPPKLVPIRPQSGCYGHLESLRPRDTSVQVQGTQ